MVERPLVSVVVIFLNAEKFMREAIESVFAQTYENWELLLVDDGSTDSSTIIAKEYAERYPQKIRYLEHEGHQNKGISATRNLGIANAHGEFIAFLDADDVYLPNKLERQVAIMEQYPDIGLVLNPTFYWYVEEDDKRRPELITLLPGHHPAGAWFNKILESVENAGSICGILIRKDLVAALGGFEESWRRHFDEYVLWTKVSLHTSIYYEPECVALYRIRSTPSTWFRYLKHQNYAKFTSELLSVALHLAPLMLRQLAEMKQIEVAAALSQSLELQIPELLKGAEWNYLSAFLLHQLQVNTEEALHRYDLALEHGFDEFWVRYNRGSLHAKLGNLEQARADLKRALELKPDHEGAKQMLAQLS
jgi:glycosyltransferase involved in cell wall biosynthesis